MQKKAQLSCTSCSSVGSLHWLFNATHAIAHGRGPMLPAEVRSYRRQLERGLRRHHALWFAEIGPGKSREFLNWMWDEEVKRHPELYVPGHRYPVPVSSLVLYVLTAAVAAVLEHARDDLPTPAERESHFRRAGPLVFRIFELARSAPYFERRGLEYQIVARLLDLHGKLVALRLKPSAVQAELAAARARGSSSWVSPQQLLWAARYRRDVAIIYELYRQETVIEHVSRIVQWRRQLAELLTASHRRPLSVLAVHVPM